ncbi:hypothetical protein PVW46_24720 [Mameliella sp. AT18]|uniref:hypothetical protein n=1 Tax=Mameliella sp. AT18 TaxID=3028385 RepID=UPI00237A175B|nr:hypothetical protein [Mameliella sp. AT18]MDD9733117.1 hypothetical protein [Mameliella sp. AT18]
MTEDENLTVVDLFGNTRYLTPRKKGRPPFERTEENAHKVSMLLAMGWNNERIAGCILDPRTGKPISVPTLKRHFRSELQVREVARDQMNARRMERLWQAAEQGNVGADRLLDKLIEKNDRALADAALGDRPRQAKPEKKGKKELSAENAKSAEDRLRAEAQRARTH